MRLLLVEDNARLASLIREGLDRQGFAVDWCETVDGAEHALRINDYDLMLLDLGLPDGEGLDLVRSLRRRQDMMPILVLTARGGLDDRVMGLDAGADDYLVKPFQIPELAARCRALLRRPGASLGTHLTVGNVILDSEWCCKIADFGRSQELFQVPKSKRKAAYRIKDLIKDNIPLRWTAPEVHRLCLLTFPSDKKFLTTFPFI